MVGQVVNRKQVRLFAGLALLLLGLAACAPPASYGTPSGSDGVTSPPSNFRSGTPPPGTTAGSLVALDAKTGRVLWHVQAPMAAISAPVVSQGLVFVQGGYDCRIPTGVLAAFQGRDGALLWQAPTAPSHAGFSLCSSESPPAAMLGVVMVAAAPQGSEVVIRGLDPKSGRELWTTSGSGPTSSSGPLLTFVQFLSGRAALQGLDPLSGRQRWLAKLNSAGPPIAVNSQSALVSGSYGQYGAQVSLIDLATGDVQWQYPIGDGAVATVALSDVAVVSFRPLPTPPQFAATDQSLIALDGVTGKQLWRHDKIQSSSPLPLFSIPGSVFAEQLPNPPDPNHCTFSIQALDSRSGAVRWTRSNIPGCADAFYPGFATDASTSVLMYPAGSATKIVALDATAGTTLWERQLPQSPMCNPSTPQCALVKATIAGGVVYVAASGQFIYPQGD